MRAQCNYDFPPLLLFLCNSPFFWCISAPPRLSSPYILHSSDNVISCKEKVKSSSCLKCASLTLPFSQSSIHSLLLPLLPRLLLRFTATVAAAAAASPDICREVSRREKVLRGFGRLIFVGGKINASSRRVPSFKSGCLVRKRGVGGVAVGFSLFGLL